MQLVGLARIGRDAELKQTNSGQSVLNFPLAYNYGKDKATQWVECAMFGERAAKVASYFTKGTAIVAYLDNVHVETYSKKDGSTGVKLVAMLNGFEFCGKSEARAEPAERPAQAEKPKLPGNFQNMPDDDPEIPF